MQMQNKFLQMFIGRTSQFEELAKVIHNDHERQIVSIQGDGGVGKTFLLKEVYRRYSSRQDIQCFPVIDFYQIKTRKFLWVLDMIAADAPDHFRTYYSTKQQLDVKPEVTGHLISENDIIDAFYSDLEKLEQRYRCIFLFDTIELIQETIVLDLLNLVKASKRSIFVMAGRRNEELIPTFTDEFGHRAVCSLQLGGFPEQDAIAYMKQIPAGAELTDDDQRTLYLLSNSGIPVKLALALDWLSRGWALSSLLQYTHKDLIESLNGDGELYQQAIKAFEIELVTQVGRLGTDVDQVVYTMAHVNKRFNQQLLNRLLPSISDPGILDKIGALPFVKVIEKDFYVLHDEVQRIILQRVWGQSDPTGEIRREISKKVVQYYDAVLEDLQSQRDANSDYESDSWINRIERLFYQLDINLADGYRSFTGIFEELKDRRDLGQIELAALALDILLKDRTLPARLYQFVETYYRGWILVRRANYLEQALKIINRGLDKILSGSVSTSQTERRIFLEREVDQRVGEIYTLLGYTQRRLGNWREAIEYFEQARQLNEQQIDMLKASTSPPEELIQRSVSRLAETLNDIANLHRMRGDLDIARLYCKTSLVIRRRLGEDRKVGHCCYVMSMIMWELGNTSEAMHYLRQARRQYQLTEAVVLERVWVDRYEGYILFRTGNLADALRLTKLALDTADSERLTEERAQAHLVLSRIYRTKGEVADCEQALINGEDALEIGNMEHNDFIIAESHLTTCLAINALLGHSLDQARQIDLRQKFASSLKAGRDIATKRHYARQLILFNDLLADLKFAEKSYLEAFGIYLQNWHEALKFKPSVFGRSLIRPLELLYGLARDNADEALSVCDMLLEGWGDEANLDENYAGLRNEIQYIRDVAQAVLDRRSYELTFYQEFHQGSWQKAVRICEAMEKVPVYDHASLATIMHQRAELYHSANLFSLAKIFCERAIRIRREYERFIGQRPVGDSKLLLSQIYWKLGMTSEASQALAQAESAYAEAYAEVGVGLAHLERGLMAFRIHDLDKARESLRQAQTIFERIHENTYLAQALNILGRINRVDMRNPEYTAIRFKEAERRGHDALKILSDRDWYVAAEIHLTLCILHYMWGRRLIGEGKTDQADQHFEQAESHNREGWRKIEQFDTPVLISVYRGMQANLYLQRGDKERARLHFLDELVHSTRTKHMRFIGALDLLENMLISDSSAEVVYDLRWFIDSWRAKGLAESFPQVEQSLTWIAGYRRFFPEQIATLDLTVA